MGLLADWRSSLLAPAMPSGIGGPFFWGYAAFSGGMHVFTQYLELRQLRKNRETALPKEVKDLGVEEKAFLETQSYQRDRRCASMLFDSVNLAWSYVSQVYINPWAWRLAIGVCGGENECRSTLLWMLITTWVDKPLSVAESLYKNFVIEERHGFNKMTCGLFFGDLVKSELLSYALAGPLIPGAIRLVRWGGERFHLYLWAAAQGLVFAFMWIYPNFIQPLFNKFEPLKDVELRKKIGDLAAEEEFPLTKLFQVDGSKRSSHSNAYFFGFWKNKRIVIYDTLLSLRHDQILAVLCHELGHWKFNHITYNLIITSAHLFGLFWSFGRVMFSPDTSKEIIRSFGYGESNAIILSFMIYSMLVEPVEQVIAVLMTLHSRSNEFQADRFAVKKGRGEELASGLLQMSQENKGDLNPDWLYAWYHFSHPALVERLRALPKPGKSL